MPERLVIAYALIFLTLGTLTVLAVMFVRRRKEERRRRRLGR